MMNALEILHLAENPGIFLDWGPFSIQIGNLVVIALMVVMFVLALFLPFPGGKRRK
ncbi:hypothetical protein GCM10022381_12690 [Leifsonia kafniensis]|uniref:Uncharacterized protein n=1 Tax=Leifsonia kafniensis TaxID=475957 RepID=A0ABP7KA96_9MICO